MVVDNDDHYVSLRHSFWELSLPKDWVDRTPRLSDFFDRQIPAQKLNADTSPELRGLLQLLKEQGCLSYPDQQESYTLKEIKELFTNLCAQWYGAYYAHPLWQRLRDGSLSINALVAWLIHNYHVSRSAGMSDARCATRLLKLGLRPRFAHNALEEYSHCDDFYFVRHPKLSLADDEVKNYVHLPSSLAFDHQMLRMAEDDWLGHVLVSFFQESTVRFLDDCKTFYQVVERNYGIEDFFAPWQRHIELDLEYGHASNFAFILSADESISKTDMVTSLRNARFTFEFLVSALDAILAEDVWGEKIYLRSPIKNGQLDPNKTALLAPYTERADFPAQLRAKQAIQLYEELQHTGLAIFPLQAIPQGEMSALPDKEFIRSDVTLSIYKTLSYADSHDTVVLYGRLAQEATLIRRACSDKEFARPPLPRSFRARALGNFISEHATNPTLFAFLLFHLAELDSTCAPFSGEGQKVLRQYLSSIRTDDVINSLYTTRLLQLNEFYTQALLLPSTIDDYDFFFD